MDAKDLRTEPVVGERNNDGKKYTQTAAAVQCDRNKQYHDIGSNPLGKVDVPTSRPCAVIGPDRVLPPSTLSDAYIKKALNESWPSPDNIYRRPPEYPHKIEDYQNPTRNISPRQTFQENMPRIMVPPRYNAAKINEDPNFAIERNVPLSKNVRLNVPPEAKYCDVPYTVNEQKNIRSSEICVSNVNPGLVRGVPHGWPPGVNVRPARPYGTPELYQFPEYSSCAAPRLMPMARPHRTVHEESGHVYPDPYYSDGNIRFKPYPPVKDRYPPPRYDYVNNYSNPYHQPYKYDLQKSIPPHPYPGYPMIPPKFIDNRMTETIVDGYQRLPNQQVNYNVTFRNQVVHPLYGPMGNGLQNKLYPYPPDSSAKASNKITYDSNNKTYIDYENARTKTYLPLDGYYGNEISRQTIKNQVLPPYPSVNMHTMPPHPYYKKDNSTIKNYEYMTPIRNMDPLLHHPSRLPPHHFSPNMITMSPSDSATSNDAMQINSLEDCGYVSQSSTTSTRSMDTPLNRIPSDFYRSYDHRYGPVIRTSPLISKIEPNSHPVPKGNKNLDVRQFLQMWNEGDDENGENINKDIVIQTSDTNNFTKQCEVINNQEQLYVLGLVKNVPSEELSKYEHIQKVSKLPENIKGYTSIELLDQFEEAIESSNINNNFNSKLPTSTETHSHLKSSVARQSEYLSRPLSPLDVESKISQSVIHKEVGCNFEIKPCSPKMLNVEIATPVQTILGERAIEKVANPLIRKSPLVLNNVQNTCGSMKHQDQRTHLSENLKVPSCKMISTQYSTNNTNGLLKDNYMLQDLESNSGVCLASLPRLDNDIELNFPEVNQQFINANKMESVITMSKDLSTLDAEQSNQNTIDSENLRQQENEVSSNFSANVDSENEFAKLSKYRKLKVGGIETKESNSQNQVQTVRTDSVIIMNPEPFVGSEVNVKSASCVDNTFIDNQPDSISLYTNNKNPINDIENDFPLDTNIQEGQKHETYTSNDIAIDFSLSSFESNSSENKIDANMQYINQTIEACKEDQCKKSQIDLAVDEFYIKDNNKESLCIIDAAESKNDACIIPKRQIKDNSDLKSALNFSQKSDGADTALQNLLNIGNDSEFSNEDKANENVNEISKHLLTNSLEINIQDGTKNMKSSEEQSLPTLCKAMSQVLDVDRTTKPNSHDHLRNSMNKVKYQNNNKDIKGFLNDDNVFNETVHTPNNSFLEVEMKTASEDNKHFALKIDNEISFTETENKGLSICEQHSKMLIDKLDKPRKKVAISMRKELNSPWIQKLMIHNVDLNRSNINNKESQIITTTNQTNIENCKSLTCIKTCPDNEEETKTKLELVNDKNLLHTPSQNDCRIGNSESLNKQYSVEDNSDSYNNIVDTTSNLLEKKSSADYNNYSIEGIQTNFTVTNISNNEIILDVEANIPITQKKDKENVKDSVEVKESLSGETKPYSDMKEKTCCLSDNREKMLSSDCETDDDIKHKGNRNCVLSSIGEKSSLSPDIKESNFNNDLRTKDNCSIEYADCVSASYKIDELSSFVIKGISNNVDFKGLHKNKLSSYNHIDNIVLENDRCLYENFKMKEALQCSIKDSDRNKCHIPKENCLFEGVNIEESLPLIKETDINAKQSYLSERSKVEIPLSSCVKQQSDNMDNGEKTIKPPGEIICVSLSAKEQMSILSVIKEKDKDIYEKAKGKESLTSISKETKFDVDLREKESCLSESVKSHIEDNINNMDSRENKICILGNVEINRSTNNKNFDKDIDIQTERYFSGEVTPKDTLTSDDGETNGGTDLKEKQNSSSVIFENNSLTQSVKDTRTQSVKELENVDNFKENERHICRNNAAQKSPLVHLTELCVGVDLKKNEDCFLEIVNKIKKSTEYETNYAKNVEDDYLFENVKEEKILPSNIDDDIIARKTNNNVDKETCLSGSFNVEQPIIDENDSTIIEGQAVKSRENIKLNDNDVIPEVCQDNNNIYFGELDSNDNLCEKYNEEETQIFESVPCSNNMNLITRRKALKRSLSDSALNKYSDCVENLAQDGSENTWSKKRRKIEDIKSHIIAEDFCNLIQNHRRNSISSIYKQENVSFCIFIDNDCILTNENDETEKVCFTELPDNCVTDINSECNNNDEENMEITGANNDTYQENNDCEYSDPFIVEEVDQKTLDESWVDDVACIETVVSDDIVEDIVSSAPVSPKENNSSDYECDENELEIFNSDISDHINKVKDIYGDKMCSYDAELVKTLYRTPQMNVNKTLFSREFSSDEEYNRVDKVLEDILSDAEKHEDCPIKNGCVASDDISIFQSVNSKEMSIDKNSLQMHFKDFTSPLEDEHNDLNITLNNNIFENYNSQPKIISEQTQDDTVHSCESSVDNVFSYDKRENKTKCTSSCSPEVSSTTSEDKNSGILLKITNYKGSKISQLTESNSLNNNTSCKFTEDKDYLRSNNNLPATRPLITKGAQKYIPPLRETIRDLKIKLPLPQQSLLRLKLLKISKEEPKSHIKKLTMNTCKSDLLKNSPKKTKPKFEDVLKSIDEIQFKMHKEKNKKTKKSIPKVVIKKNENGSHYASTFNKEPFNPDMTGRKWQPWVFLEKNHFIDKMVIKNKTKAIFSHRKQAYVVSENFQKYKSVSNAKFIISQQKLDEKSKGQLKYTIRLKQAY